MLHAPHANYEVLYCDSARKVVAAAEDAQRIVVSVHDANQDPTMLNPFCMVCLASCSFVRDSDYGIKLSLQFALFNISTAFVAIMAADRNKEDQTRFQALQHHLEIIW